MKDIEITEIAPPGDNYTTGPYEVVEGKFIMQKREAVLLDKRAFAVTIAILNEQPPGLKSPKGTLTRKQIEANGRLLASAPELLAALRKLLKYNGKEATSIFLPEDEKMALAAIKKATGKIK